MNIVQDMQQNRQITVAVSEKKSSYEELPFP